MNFKINVITFITRRKKSGIQNYSNVFLMTMEEQPLMKCARSSIIILSEPMMRVTMSNKVIFKALRNRWSSLTYYLSHDQRSTWKSRKAIAMS